MCDVRNNEFYHNSQLGLQITIGEVVNNYFRNNGSACFFGLADYTHPATGNVHDYCVFRDNEVRNNDGGLAISLNDTLRVYTHNIRGNIFCDNPDLQCESALHGHSTLYG